MRKYRAFISYSHSDKAEVEWLHRALETYRIPKALVGTETAAGVVPRRLSPIFRDRDELASSGDLGAELTAALEASDFLVVVCSPRAARSRWVNEEVRRFKVMRGPLRVLALVVAGEPGSGSDDECFPPALRFQVTPDGTVTQIPAEPIAADLRAEADGKRYAKLKLVAGLIGVPLDALVRRDAARRTRRLAVLAAAAAAGMSVTGGLAVYANGQRIEAVHQRTFAEQQRATSDASLDFMIKTFEVADPATENPRTITALTVLQRGSDRIESELAKQPLVRARLLRTMGETYINLGLLAEGERDLKRGLAADGRVSDERTTAILRLAYLNWLKNDLPAASRWIADADKALARTSEWPGGTDDAPALRARAVELRGLISYKRGEIRDAVTGLKRASAMFAAAPGDQVVARARVLVNTGIFSSQIGDHEGARRALEQAVALRTKHFGPDHVETANALQNQAYEALESKRLGEAQVLARRTTAIFRNVLDPSHPRLADLAILRGRIAYARKDFGLATSEMEQAARIYTKLFGARSPKVGDALSYEAEMRIDMGQTDAALALLDRARAAYDAGYGPNHPDQAELNLIRAKALSKAQHPDAAAASCEAAVALLRRLQSSGAAAKDAMSRCAELLPDRSFSAVP